MPNGGGRGFDTEGAQTNDVRRLGGEHCLKQAQAKESSYAHVTSHL